MIENLNQTRNDPVNQFYAYVTRDDFLDVYDDDDVVLTIRNFEKYETNTDVNNSNDEIKLSVKSQWKKIDVRLVTNDGETMRTDLNDDSNSDNDVELNDIETKSLSQGYEKKSNRRNVVDRRKIDENDTNIIDLNDRLETARILLGYRPPRKHRKRNLDDVSDSFESRYRKTVS